MNTDNKLWYVACPTPIIWNSMKTAIVDDTCYFMGGYIGDHPNKNGKVYSVSLPALVSQLDSCAKDKEMWKEIPQLPVQHAAPVSISGSLLAVGGHEAHLYEAVSAIHLYQPDAGQWVKVLDMPTQRYDCTSIMTTDQELFIAGGRCSYQLTCVDIAQI